MDDRFLSPLGAIVITPHHGDWQTQQRAVFRRARFTVGKTHLPPGFATSPDHVADLIEDGARTVILRTEDAHLQSMMVASDLFDRGFVEVIEDYPHVQWWIQVGNEPEHYDPKTTPAAYRRELLEVYDALHDHPQLRSLHWIAAMPISLAFYDVLMADSAITSRYDALGCNLYGHWHLGDTGNEKQRIYERSLATGHPVWIVEAGINGPLADEEKARRIMNFWQQLNQQPLSRRHLGLVLFSLGVGTAWPTYEITERMAAVFAERDRNRERHFPETGHTLRGPFLSYWEQHGAIRLLGYPISPELIEDGRIVQYTERARLEWHENNPPEWRVLGGHLGREVYRQRYAG